MRLPFVLEAAQDRWVGSGPCPATPPFPENNVTNASRTDVVCEHAHALSWRTMDWPNTLGIGFLHAGCLLAPFYFSWSGLAVAIFLWWACGGLGICLCYHRLLTHRSFRTPRIVEYFLTVLGTMNWQGSPIRWVGQHRIHHKHSDGDGDPHSPEHGFNWSHILWCLTRDPEDRNARDAARDLQRDRFIRSLDRYHYLPQIMLGVVLYFIGTFTVGAGLSWVIWGCFVRSVLVYHATWFVNSAGHTWGYRNFDLEDNSRNSWWVALLSFGEGWHNNHHASQRTARHGLRWYEFDMTYLTIRLMGLVGLARDIVPPKGRAQATG